jgi:zinc transport system ATP-binding protein
MNKQTGDNGYRQEVISIRHMWAGYDNESVLEDINLTAYALDFIGLIGPNGGGKTTLIKVLLGLLPPTRGTVKILGKDVAEGRTHVGYVPQMVEFDRDFPINVWDVVRMGRLGGRSLLHPFSRKDDDLVAEALRSVDILDLRRRPIGDLSGGQRQRVYIARALVTQPSILLLDEPTASVDAHVQAHVYELLRELNKKVTILLITHDMSMLSSYVKTVGCLNRRLYYHGDRQLTPEMLEDAFQCPIDLIAHGVPHRVFPQHVSEDVTS